MEIRKYQQGGYSINPIIYNPSVRATTASGGATQASSGSDKKDNEFIDDALKEIFKTEGLNSDYSALMDYIDKIGLNALNGADPMFSLTKLTTALRYANAVKTNKKEYDSAMQHMYSIHSENDTAVSAKGGVFVLRDNKLTSVNINDLQEGETPLTNAELSSIRSESGAFNNFLTETVKGSTSHAQIKTIVQNAITNLGEYAKDNTYFLNPTSQDSYNRAAKAGLVNALAELNIGIDDLRKTEASNLISLQIKDKNNAAQVKSTINNIAVSLSTNQKILLELKARENGIKGGYMDIIALYVSQVAKSDYTTDVDLFDTISGTRGKNKTGESTQDDLGSLEFNETLQLMLGLGDNKLINIHEGTQAQITGIGTLGILTNKSGEALGKGNANKLLESSIAGSLDDSNITFGGIRISTNGLSFMALNDSNVVSIDLPFDKVKYANEGIITPDIGLAKKVQEVENYIRSNNIKDPEQINKIYQDKGLDVKYIGTDANGLPILNVNTYRRFIAASVTADQQASDTSFEDNSLLRQIDEHSTEAKDLLKSIEDYYGKDSYGLSSHYKFNELWFGPDEIYKGVLYIPLLENAINAYLGSSEKVTMDQANLLEAVEQQKDRIQYAQQNRNKGNHTDWGLNYGTKR